MKKVLIVQRRLTHYRVPFFENLKGVMRQNGIELILAHGVADSIEAKKNDHGKIDWALVLNTHYYLNGKICWQPFSHLMQDVDAIVIGHENKLIFNLIPQWFYKNKKVILWGHGANLQKENHDWKDFFKSITAKKADWWLAYTQMSVPLIEKCGFPKDRITVLNNSIDTKTFYEDFNNLTEENILNTREKYNIFSDNLGIFIGSLYEEKRLVFLIESVQKIRKKYPDFEIIIAGNGPQRDLVENYTNKYPWIHYVGLVRSVEKASLLSISKVILNPGLVGLGILDSFISQTPMITTDCKIHSPEVVYLENGKNGIMTSNNLDDYSDAVIDLISDPQLLVKLIEGCKLSGEKYTLDNMVLNFTKGVVSALNNSSCRFSL